MQVNRLSTGLQEELKVASHFNTARSDTLFGNDDESGDGTQTDFGNYDVDDLGITSRKIKDLLNGFSDEVIKVFSSEL